MLRLPRDRAYTHRSPSGSVRGYPARTWNEFVAYFVSRFQRSRRKWNGTHCLEWTGARSGHGYGNVHWRGKFVPTHRMVWMIAKGSIPDGLHVLHHCDNRPCGNEGHLFLGTPKDNHDDMRIKRRESSPPRYVGSQHPQSKLNERQAASIKRARARGVHVNVLAKKYGVARQLISRISRGEIWAHVPGPITKSPYAGTLDERQVTSIKSDRARGLHLKVLAVKYGVSRQTISRIARGDRWPHISGPITKCKKGWRS